MRRANIRSSILLLVALVLLVLPITAQGEGPSCSAEFDTCVMSRDCCGDLTCVTGDWAVTTDSTCLSERSEQLNALPPDKRVHMLYTFYQQSPGIADDKRKSLDDVKALVDKHARSFAQLVTRIEKRYNLPIEQEKSKSDEL